MEIIVIVAVGIVAAFFFYRVIVNDKSPLDKTVQ